MNKYLDKIGLELYHDLLQTELSHLVNELSDVIYLLDITDTPPATCSAGDMYFNTTQNKIYTATDTNTWGSTGENPKNKIYINLNTSESYRWNGSSLVDLDNCIIEGYYSNGNFYTAPPITHDYVEINGVKWATMNLGTGSEANCGLYFQWGDTQGYTTDELGSGSGKKAFDWADYKYCDGTDSVMTKYNSTDGKTVLDAADDAVTAAWGGNWRMPTEAEFNELINTANTTSTWTSVDGVSGVKFTSKTDNTKYVFFPASGYCYNGSLYESVVYGYVWSSTLYSSNVTRSRRLGFLREGSDVSSYARRVGLPVRGIYDGPTSTLIIPTTKAIYIDKETNIPYRWTGSTYVPLTKEVDIISDQEILDLFGGEPIDLDDIVVGTATPDEDIEDMWEGYDPLESEEEEELEP